MHLKRLASLTLAAGILLTCVFPVLTAQAKRPRDSGEQDINPFEVYQVSLPSDLGFVIDPYEKAGKGQLYSKPFVVANHGTSAVMVTLENARCDSSEDSGVQFMQDPVDPFTESGGKDVQIFLRRTDGKRKLVIPLSEAPAGPVRFLVESGDEAIFEAGGTINPNPKNPWVAGDIKISASFGIEPVRTRRVSLDGD